jgi:hypothetical protein
VLSPWWLATPGAFHFVVFGKSPRAKDENLDMMAPQQYEAAKKDVWYFLVLIEMAIGFYGAGDHDLGTVH